MDHYRLAGSYIVILSKLNINTLLLMIFQKKCYSKHIVPQVLHFGLFSLKAEYVLAILSHIGWIYSFILYEILIGKYTFCLNRTHNQLCTSSGSWYTTYGLFSHMAECVLPILCNIGWFYTYILYKSLKWSQVNRKVQNMVKLNQ